MMNEFANIDMELDPSLKRMFLAYGNIPERDPESARRTRDNFLAEINNIVLEPTRPRAATRRSMLAVWTLGLERLREGLVPVYGRRIALRGLVAFMIMGAILFGGVGTIAYAAASSLPGDVIYPLKTTFENAQVGFTNNSETKTRLYLEFAARRLMEMQVLIEAGRYADLAQAAKEFERDVQMALSVVESLSQSDPARTSALTAEVFAILQGYRDILAQMLTVIPADIQPVIRNAMNASSPAVDDDEGAGDDDENADTSTPTPTLPATPIDTVTPQDSATSTPTPETSSTAKGPMPNPVNSNDSRDDADDSGNDNDDDGDDDD